jgi:preprotein translocase subunit SecG
MENDDLDRMFLREDEILPSSGFAGNVMDVVRREVEIPPLIPFPWRWAVPGIVVGAVVVAALLTAVLLQPGRGTGTASTGSAVVFQQANNLDLQWIAIALLTVFLSFTVSMRLTGAKT